MPTTSAVLFGGLFALDIEVRLISGTVYDTLPTVVGTIADARFFDEAFLLLAGIATVATLPSLFVPERGSAGLGA